MLLQKGTPAPPFELYATPDQKLSLTDLRGKPIILAFYPADWSPVCGDQMALFNETLAFFHPYKAELIGISVDSTWSHLAFSQNRKLHFPLLADFEPKGAVSSLFGAYNEISGQCRRALFVIDEQGVIQWSFLSPDGINPGADGILAALKNISQNKKE